MKNENASYRSFATGGKWAAFLLLALLTITGFAQGPDSVVAVDTIPEYEDTTGRYEDSLKQAQYNFYINREEWQTDSFEFRQVPDTVIGDLQSQDDFWYANKGFKKKKPVEEPRTSFWAWLSLQEWYRILVWIFIIGGFIAALIWYLSESQVRLFRRKPKNLAGAGEEIITENIFEINYQKEVNKAVNAGNYRLAVRLLFLKLLKQLSEREIIEYRQDRTNFDYLLQLNQTAYYKDFFRLTRNYEYTWYGRFDINPELFTLIKNDFEKFDNRIQ